MSPKSNPAEMPEGGEGGSSRPSGGIKIPTGGGPGEFSPFQTTAVQAIINEVFNLTSRVQLLETQLLSLRLRPGLGGPAELPAFDFSTAGGGRFGVRHGGGVGPQELPAFEARSFRPGPQELPEGGEGGGGGIIRRPGEIHELPPFEVGRLLQEITSLHERMKAVEANVLSSIQALSQRLEKK
jgi:hypothetical protein